MQQNIRERELAVRNMLFKRCVFCLRGVMPYTLTCGDLAVDCKWRHALIYFPSQNDYHVLTSSVFLYQEMLYIYQKDITRNKTHFELKINIYLDLTGEIWGAYYAYFGKKYYTVLR